jgi:Cu/Ag efflux pump CusA
MQLSEVNEFADTLIAQRISTVAGVAQVSVYGPQKYAVRAQLDPRALASRGLGIDGETHGAMDAGQGRIVKTRGLEPCQPGRMGLPAAERAV